MPGVKGRSGGKRENQTGRPPLPDKEKKERLLYFVKRKHRKAVHRIITPIIEEFNNKE